MKTPDFWKSKSLTSTLLLPLAVIYDIIGTFYRVYVKPVKFPIPVICIGNLTAGGAGKTPIALHIGKMLKEKGVKTYFLSRGYGGKFKGAMIVNPAKHTAQDVGDEPLLLAQLLPTIVSPDRVLGARFAMKKGAQAIIMDDGFQNPYIAKSLSLVVVDGLTGFGNGRMLPAGPLREQPQIGFKRAHAIVVLNRTTVVPELPTEQAVLFARTLPTEESTVLRARKVFAFCGIAYPNKFFDMLTSVGAQIVDTAVFPDHHPYTSAEINKLIVKSSQQNAVLVTTSKDMVRVPPDLRDCMMVLDIAVVFEDEGILDAILDYILGRTPPEPPPEEPQVEPEPEPQAEPPAEPQGEPPTETT